MAHQSFTCQTSLLTISDNMWTIFAKSVRAVLYALQTRWESDRRKLVLAYFVSIFSCRLFLRSCLASNLHWMIVMGFEDGMSLMSFALALLYLHASNGHPWRSSRSMWLHRQRTALSGQPQRLHATPSLLQHASQCGSSALPCDILPATQDCHTVQYLKAIWFAT